VVRACAVAGLAGTPYAAGLLALREAPLIDRAVTALGEPPDLLVVNGTGLDHPRRAGLAVHLGAGLAAPSIGVTHRPLFARGEWPSDVAGARTPLLLDGEVVGYWVRLRPGTRPLAVHAGYRTSPSVAVDVALRLTGAARTPEPIREARHAARVARAHAAQPAE
jgi:deoxyribonuclease V